MQDRRITDPLNAPQLSQRPSTDLEIPADLQPSSNALTFDSQPLDVILAAIGMSTLVPDQSLESCISETSKLFAKTQPKMPFSLSPLEFVSGAGSDPSAAAAKKPADIIPAKKARDRGKQRKQAPLYDIATGKIAPKGQDKPGQYLTFDAYVSRFIKHNNVSTRTYVDTEGNELPDITHESPLASRYQTRCAWEMAQKRKEFRAILTAGNNLPLPPDCSKKSLAGVAKKSHGRGTLYDTTTGQLAPADAFIPRQHIPLDSYVKRFVPRTKAVLATYVDQDGNKVAGITNQRLYDWQVRQKRQEFKDLLEAGRSLPLPSKHEMSPRLIATYLSPIPPPAEAARTLSSSSSITSPVEPSALNPAGQAPAQKSKPNLNRLYASSARDLARAPLPVPGAPDSPSKMTLVESSSSSPTESESSSFDDQLLKCATILAHLTDSEAPLSSNKHRLFTSAAGNPTEDRAGLNESSKKRKRVLC